MRHAYKIFLPFLGFAALLNAIAESQYQRESRQYAGRDAAHPFTSKSPYFIEITLTRLRKPVFVLLLALVPLKAHCEPLSPFAKQTSTMKFVVSTNNDDILCSHVNDIENNLLSSFLDNIFENFHGKLRPTSDNQLVATNLLADNWNIFKKANLAPQENPHYQNPNKDGDDGGSSLYTIDIFNNGQIHLVAVEDEADGPDGNWINSTVSIFYSQVDIANLWLPLDPHKPSGVHPLNREYLESFWDLRAEIDDGSAEPELKMDLAATRILQFKNVVYLIRQSTLIFPVPEFPSQNSPVSTNIGLIQKSFKTLDPILVYKLQPFSIKNICLLTPTVVD